MVTGAIRRAESAAESAGVSWALATSGATDTVMQ
jgi:hypothetical protein